MWMPPGSFWTQPKGEVHITSAKGETTIALVEIDTGPYLVMPPEQAFDSGERPVNVHEQNIVWVTPSNLPVAETSPKIAYLWGNPENGGDYGTFIRLPAGFKGHVKSTGSTFRVVVIKGQPQYLEGEPVTLDPGSYLSSSVETKHPIQSHPKHASVFYVRTNGPYQIVPLDNR